MPTIDLNNCTRCLKCVKDCPAFAITIETGVISKNCIHCGHCVAICPEATVFPDHGEIVPLRPNPVTAEDFSLLSAGLRSCRNYQQKEVPEEMLLQLVANLRHAPSASNSRQLEVAIVHTPEKVQLLNHLTEESLIALFSLVTSPFVSPFLKLFSPKLDIQKLKRYKKSFIRRRKENNSMICHHAPAVLLFHGPVSKTGMLEADANIWATYTTLYAHSMGLATCFIGFIVKAFGKSGKHNHHFGIPPGNRIYASLVLGYPKVKYKQECSRESPAVTMV